MTLATITPWYLRLKYIMDWAATMYEYTKSGRLIFFTSNGKRTAYLVVTACGWHILVTWVIHYCAVRIKPILTARISNRRILCFHCWRRSRRAPNETGETSIVFTSHTKYRIAKIAYTECISVASYVRVFFEGRKIFFSLLFLFRFFPHGFRICLAKWWLLTWCYVLVLCYIS